MISHPLDFSCLIIWIIRSRLEHALVNNSTSWNLAGAQIVIVIIKLKRLNTKIARIQVVWRATADIGLAADGL